MFASAYVINRRGLLLSALALAGSAAGAPAASVPEELRVAVSTFSSEQLDPTKEAPTAVANMQLLMFDTILEIGENSEIVPGLATSWSTAPDGVTWTFHLRPGVQFHGGYGEISAEDVKFSLERWMNPKATHSELGLINSIVSAVNVIDKYTFQIVTKGPQPDLLYSLAPNQSSTGIVFSKKHLTEKGGDDFDAQSDALNNHPIGSGPYEFVSRTRGQRIVYQATNNHWRVKPYIQRVEFMLIPDASTRVSMLRSGETDLIPLDSDRVDEITTSEGLELRSVSQAINYMVIFSGTYRGPAQSKPTAKLAVRRALSMAIDRQTILDALVGGRGTLPTTPPQSVSSTIGVDADRYKAWAKEIATYDPASAKKMLADAGYPDGFDGVKLFVLNRAGGLQMGAQVLQAIAAQWAEIGARVELVTVDYATFRPHFINAPVDDPYNAGDAHGFDVSPWFTSQKIMSTYFSYAAKDAQLIKEPEFDQLLWTISEVADPHARAERWNRLWDYVTDSWVNLPIMNVDALFGVNKEAVGKWTARPGWPYMGRMIETIKKP